MVDDLTPIGAGRAAVLLAAVFLEDYRSIVGLLGMLVWFRSCCHVA